ncbi:MAG: hypothetical protein AB1689_18645 [Thermodesulfobacteriota bacterium]
MRNTRLLSAAFLVGIVALVVWLSTSIGQVECRVCIEFGGLRNCATAAAPTEEEAVHSARTTACGTISGGVRDSIACGNTPPVERSCRGG